MLSFKAMKYDDDVKEAALSHEDFDERNAENIGSFFGEDPRVVMIDIKEERWIMTSRRLWG